MSTSAAPPGVDVERAVTHQPAWLTPTRPSRGAKQTVGRQVRDPVWWVSGMLWDALTATLGEEDWL